MIGSALKARLAARLGASVEADAQAHLERRGLKAIDRNWRCTLGELDVVMADGETLVIVEVRARSTSTHGGALENITAKKRGRLMRAALAYTQAHPQWLDAPLRFDVMVREADGQLCWLPNAFDADDR